MVGKRNNDTTLNIYVIISACVNTIIVRATTVVCQQTEVYKC